MEIFRFVLFVLVIFVGNLVEEDLFIEEYSSHTIGAYI